MLELLTPLLALACPLGMGAMMFAPALLRRFGRRHATATPTGTGGAASGGTN
jgi:hypothetical protein